MRPSPLFALVALAFTACGESSPAKKYGTPPVKEVESALKPAEYVLEDPACQDARTPTTLTRTTIRAWQGDQVVEKEVDLSLTSSTDSSLVTPVISLTSWKDVYTRQCDLDRGEAHRCDDKEGYEKGWALQGTGGDLKICQDGHNYGRLSYEGVALTSSYYLSKAYDRYAALSKADLPQQVQLSVLPHFIDFNDHYIQDGERSKLKTYIVHNLAYFPVGQMIAVFPESAERSDAYTGYFWESEFVLGHEYGHHIDFTRHGKVLANAGLEWNPVMHGFADTVRLRQGLSADSDRSLVQGALSEAFADLLAFYSEGATGASLVGLPDIGRNRSIAAATFGNGDDKILTEDRLSILFGLVDAGETAQGEPKYTDIHVVGAIFSHTADQIFQTLTKTRFASGSQEDVDQRYKMVLTWMDSLVEGTAKLTAEESGTDVLQPVALAFEKVADAFLASFPLTEDGGLTNDTVRTELCLKAKSLLPALQAGPFATAAGRCE